MIVIYPSALNGEISAIASKSDAHRSLICAALSDAPTKIELTADSEDIRATISCIQALGAEVKKTKNVQGNPEYEVIPAVAEPARRPVLDCNESGTTLRLLLPVAAAMFDEAAFAGSGRLPERPLSPLLEEMEKHGCRFSARQIPLSVKGRLKGGVFTLPGNVSSQYVSGLMLALPLTEEGGSIKLVTELESSGYVDMTIETLRKFGVAVDVLPSGFTVSGGQLYRTPGTHKIEGDFSNAAFWLTAGALSGTISCASLNRKTKQPDSGIVAVLRRMGADIDWSSEDSIRVHRSTLHATEIDASEIPDLVPVLAIAASVAKGTTVIRNAGRLRLKESDRLSAVADNLRRIGGDVKEYEDGLEITGVEQLEGGEIEGYNDHRIVMAFAVASTVSRGPILIHGEESVNKSYPDFFSDFKKLGGTVIYRDPRLGSQHNNIRREQNGTKRH
jgi:3-phosphoshikimate 1-carboxyvinyltransferase